MIIDGSKGHIDIIRRQSVSHRHSLTAVNAFITTQNINKLLSDHISGPEIGILSVDIDGNDYWIWKEITVVEPSIVISEYNHRFGPDRAVTTPYKADFVRGENGLTNIFHGASQQLLQNAFFFRKDLCPASLPARTAQVAFVQGRFREMRDSRGVLTLDPPEREAQIVSVLSLVEV